MKKIMVLFLILSGCLLSVSAQINPGRITVSGGLGLQFGDYTLVNISPQVGYNLSSKINIGAGFSYSYFGEKYSQTRYNQSYLGFNLYTKFYPLPYIVLMVQPEACRMWKTVEQRETNDKDRTSKFIPSCVVGGGLRLGPVTAMVKYDLAQNSDSPYGSRLFYSLGYTFSF